MREPRPGSGERGLELLAAESELWAMAPGPLTHLAGALATAAELPVPKSQQRVRFDTRGRAANTPGVTVIQVAGPLTQYGSRLLELLGLGGSSYQRIGEQVADAVNTSAVGTIVFNINSPGGGVYGATELADEIFEARRLKRTIAVASSLAASAAYWLASQAQELVVTPSGEAGSIGVYGVHVDYSEQNRMLGIRPTLISAGKFKTEANPDEPLTSEARRFLQQRVDEFYSMFVSAVARGRRALTTDVRRGFGQGRVLGARGAVLERLADRVATFDQVVFAARSTRRSNLLSR